MSESAILDSLRGGDEGAFLALVEQFHPTMVRVATSFVGSAAVAEEVAQEAWMGVLGGLASFEGRASLKTWIFRILCNCARKRGAREGRSVPFSALAAEDEEPSVAADRFQSDAEPRWIGHWTKPVQPWADEQLTTAETLAAAKRAIDALPPGQRDVITLRDIDGLSSDEVCELLEISEANQRVLLHRARSKVRAALEAHFDDGGAE